jgi:hypothetical protein
MDSKDVLALFAIGPRLFRHTPVVLAVLLAPRIR